MTAKEYLKTISREKLENLIVDYCCPNYIKIETELSVNYDFCSGSDTINCQKCWDSNIIKNENE